MSRKRGRRSGPKRSYTPYLIIGLVAVTGVVGYYIFSQSGAGSASPLIGAPVSPTILGQLAGVSLDTHSVVGVSSAVQSPKAITGGPPPLVLNSKPGVLYVGGEFCPYCASERWAMIIALDKFGSFTGLEYMQSSSTDIYPNTPTFTFRNATYTSSYITFVSVEQQDRNQQPLQPTSDNETALVKQFDTGGSIPFVDFGNKYVITGAQYLPTVFTNANWTLVASQLDNASSPFAQTIVGGANHLIAAICKIDGGSPQNVCSQSFAQTVSFTRSATSGGSQLFASDAVFRVAGPSRSGLGRLGIA